VEISFLTPLAGIFAATALVPLLVFIGRERRAQRIRTSLALDSTSLVARAPIVLALTLVPGLLGLAATQPVVDSTRTQPQRTDAQMFFVVDTSRSMLASASPRASTRFERARAAVGELRRAFPEVPAGLASLTDRVLPHLFPTTDARVFTATLANSMDVDRPPPALFLQLSTALQALEAVPRSNYFAPTASRRLLVVLTDGETREVGPDLARPFQRRPQIETLFVRFWSADERIYETGAAESAYLPVTASGPRLARASSLVGGRVFSQYELVEVRDAAHRFLGTGPTTARSLEGERLALMRYVTLAAFVPLAFLLWRRNV
jgi:hypothetical protein